MACTPSTVTLWGTTQLSTTTTLTTTITSTLPPPILSTRIATTTSCPADGDTRCMTGTREEILTVSPGELETKIETRTREGIITDLIPVQTRVIGCSGSSSSLASIIPTGTGTGSASSLISSSGGIVKIAGETGNDQSVGTLSDDFSLFTSSSTGIPISSISSSIIASASVSGSASSDSAGSSSAAGGNTGRSNGAIIAGSILAGIMVVFIIVLGCLWSRKKRGRSRTVGNGNEEYWENRFRELEREGEKGRRVDHGSGDADGDDNGDGMDGGEGLTEPKRLHLSLDLASKTLPNRPASTLSTISSFFRQPIHPSPSNNNTSSETRSDGASTRTQKSKNKIRRTWKAFTVYFNKDLISSSAVINNPTTTSDGFTKQISPISDIIISPGGKSLSREDEKVGSMNGRRSSSINSIQSNGSSILPYSTKRMSSLGVEIIKENPLNSSPFVSRGQSNNNGMDFNLPSARIEVTRRGIRQSHLDGSISSPLSSAREIPGRVNSSNIDSSRMEWIRTLYSESPPPTSPNATATENTIPVQFLYPTSNSNSHDNISSPINNQNNRNLTKSPIPGGLLPPPRSRSDSPGPSSALLSRRNSSKAIRSTTTSTSTTTTTTPTSEKQLRSRLEVARTESPFLDNEQKFTRQRQSISKSTVWSDPDLLNEYSSVEAGLLASDDNNNNIGVPPFSKSIRKRASSTSSSSRSRIRSNASSSRSDSNPNSNSKSHNRSNSAVAPRIKRLSVPSQNFHQRDQIQPELTSRFSLDSSRASIQSDQRFTIPPPLPPLPTVSRFSLDSSRASMISDKRASELPPSLPTVARDIASRQSLKSRKSDSESESPYDGIDGDFDVDIKQHPPSYPQPVASEYSSDPSPSQLIASKRPQNEVKTSPTLPVYRATTPLRIDTTLSRMSNSFDAAPKFPIANERSAVTPQLPVFPQMTDGWDDWRRDFERGANMDWDALAVKRKSQIGGE